MRFLYKQIPIVLLLVVSVITSLSISLEGLTVSAEKPFSSSDINNPKNVGSMMTSSTSVDPSDSIKTDVLNDKKSEELVEEKTTVMTDTSPLLSNDDVKSTISEESTAIENKESAEITSSKNTVVKTKEKPSISDIVNENEDKIVNIIANESGDTENHTSKIDLVSDKQQVENELVKLGEVHENKSVKCVIKNNEKIEVKKVNFTLRKSFKNVKLRIVKLRGRPEHVPKILAENDSSGVKNGSLKSEIRKLEVYSYLDIKLTDENGRYIGENYTKSMTFTFRVKKEWVKNHSIDPATVKMMRFHNGSWQTLKTHETGENDTFIYYTCETPGLSTFAIVGQNMMESYQSYSKAMINVPWPSIITFMLSATISLVIVLFKAHYIYLK